VNPSNRGDPSSRTAGVVGVPDGQDEQSLPGTSPLKRADPGFDRRLTPARPTGLPTLF